MTWHVLQSPDDYVTTTQPSNTLYTQHWGIIIILQLGEIIRTQLLTPYTGILLLEMQG